MGGLSYTKPKSEAKETYLKALDTLHMKFHFPLFGGETLSQEAGEKVQSGEINLGAASRELTKICGMQPGEAISLPPDWELHPGRKAYRYGFKKGNDFIIWLNPGTKQKPNCYIKILSEFIQRVTPEGAWEAVIKEMEYVFREAMKFAYAMGERFQVSAPHIAFDFQGDLMPMLEDSAYHVRTRFSTFRSYHTKDKLTWRRYGLKEASFQAQMYDKALEVKSNEDKVYWLYLWEQQGIDPERGVTRIEYELHNDFLRQWPTEPGQVRDLNWLMSNMCEMVKRLIECHSITIKQGENVSRYPLIPQLQEVVDTFTADYKRVTDQRCQSFDLKAQNIFSQIENMLKSYVGVSMAKDYAERFHETGDLQLNQHQAVRAFGIARRCLLEAIQRCDPKDLVTKAADKLKEKSYFAPIRFNEADGLCVNV
jgi:hypothetical protein